MPDFPQLALDQQLCFPLYAATRAVTKQYATLLDGTGLTYPQYLVLLVLWEGEEPMTVSALGARLRLDSGTLTPLLKRLESAGIVERRRDAEDERRVLIALTDAGWALRERVADVPFRLQGAMGLDRSVLESLHAELSTLIAQLDDA